MKDICQKWRIIALLVKDILQKVKDIFPQTASNDFVLSCLPFKVKEVKDILSN